MPAAAVIPAPIAYTKVVAVKKLVVGSWSVCLRSCLWCALLDVFFYLVARVCCISLLPHSTETFTLKKLECSKQAIA